MLEINLVYIDDKIDPIVEEFFNKLQVENLKLKYDSIEFKGAEIEEEFTNVLNDKKYHNPIFIVDNKLYSTSEKSTTIKYGNTLVSVLKIVYPLSLQIFVSAKNDIDNIPSYEVFFEKKEININNEKLTEYIEDYGKSILKNSEFFNNLPQDKKKKTAFNDLLSQLKNELDNISYELPEEQIDRLIERFNNMKELND